MKTIKIYLLLILPTLLFLNTINAQVLISTESDGILEEFAMLQIDSDTKGVLIPRITTDNRNAITATPGLLVYDEQVGAFFLYGKTDWINLSSSAEIWTQDATTVSLSDPTKNIGIGTIPDTSKFVVQANTGSGADDILFEVKDETGIPIFRVTSEGVRVYVKEKTKGISGGFAVGHYGSLKTAGDEFFAVTPYDTRVNTLPPAKGSKANSGGFAVGRYASLKSGAITTNFYTNPDETRIYTEEKAPGKGVSGGFAVGRYGSLKAPGDEYMHIDTDNIFIGNLAGENTNDLIGVNNVFIGTNAGQSNIGGSGNVFIGNNAGSTVVSSNKLFIDNASSDPAIALISGDFGSTKAVNLNGRLRFNTGGVAGGKTITMPDSRGAITGENFLTINHTTGDATWDDITPIITALIPEPPVQYIPPLIYINNDGDYIITDDGNIGTLIEKTEGEEIVRESLPEIVNNPGRIIKIKNIRSKSAAAILPFDNNGTDMIEGGYSNKNPLIFLPGETYTFQASSKESDEKIWYIIDYTNDNLAKNILKETAADYDFVDIAGNPESPRVYTLVIINSEVKRIDLPIAASYPNRIVVIKNGLSDGGEAQIFPNGSDKIDGNTKPVSVMIPKESFMLQSDGKDNWHIINHYVQ